MSVVPQNNVSYRIQNLDYGTFIGIVDDIPLSRTKRQAKLVVRAKKEGIRTQEWVLHKSPNGWTLQNHAGRFVIDTADPPSAQFYAINHPVPTAEWTIEQENDTNIVQLLQNGKPLGCSDAFTLGFAEQDSDSDSAKWRLIEVNPILSQTGSKFRLRGLNGRILNLDVSSNLTAVISSVETKQAPNRSLWEVTAVADGKCYIKAHGGGDNDYISCKSSQVSGQTTWVIVKGPAFAWDLDCLSGFAYQFILPGEVRNLALTIENDTEILLKANKVGHGQIWLIERDYN